MLNLKQLKIFSIWKETEANARRSFIAASLGWMMTSFDVMLYAMVLSNVINHFQMTKQTAGLMASLTLIASAFGGLLFGLVADKFGRRKAMISSILVYSVFTASCGFSSTVTALAVFRFLLGLGMGGEWASGVSLVSETWPSRHRGKVLGVVQSFWAVGYGLAALVSGLILPRLGWRAVFWVGILPVFLTVWIWQKVKEPDLWQSSRIQMGPKKRLNFSEIFGQKILKITILLTTMNSLTMFSWWGINLWIPAYLSSSVDRGGLGLKPETMAGFVFFMQVGMWLGYISFGIISDKFGRKRTYVLFLLMAAIVILLYSLIKQPEWLFFLGPVIAFFGTGFFSGFGPLTAEIYPTSVRATAQGITYNTGRIVSALAPFVVGSLAEVKGFGIAFLVISVSFSLAALLWTGIPETKGKELK